MIRGSASCKTNIGELQKTVMNEVRDDQIGSFENTPIFPHRGKIGSVSGFALLDLRSRNHGRSTFKRFSPPHNLII
jgi:hypothetical protein